MVTNTNHQEQTSAITQESISQQEKTPELTSEQMQGANMRALEKVEDSKLDNEIDIEAQGYPKIPPPDLLTYYKRYGTNYRGFVKGVFDYYINALKKARFRPSKYQPWGLVAGVYIKNQFRLNWSGIYPNITKIKPGQNHKSGLGVEKFYGALQSYVRDKQPVKFSHVGSSNITNPRPKTKDRPHVTIWGRKVHGNTMSANTGLHDEKLGWTGYSHGDINLDELLAAFGAYGATRPNNALTKNIRYNDFLVATETIKYAITRFGMAYDAGSVLGNWMEYKKKTKPIPSIQESQLDDYNNAKY